MRRVLFICTGNYYRSRYAEAVFNHLAVARNLPVRAFSRGLATWMITDDSPISPNTLAALKKLKISPDHTSAQPTPLTEADLIEAVRVIALKEQEHRPMMEKQFPQWASKIDYWQVHDIDFADPEQALPQIHAQVIALIETFSRETSGSISKTKKKPAA